MEFIGLKIVGFVIWTAVAWLFGRYWEKANSVSDIETLYASAKTAITNEIAAVEARLANLKSLV